jgi:hypothetical protein
VKTSGINGSNIYVFGLIDAAVDECGMPLPDGAQGELQLRDRLARAA